MTAYEEGYMLGVYKREADDPEFDPRWYFADHARAGTFASFKRGFEDGFAGREKPVETL